MRFSRLKSAGVNFFTLRKKIKNYLFFYIKIVYNLNIYILHCQIGQSHAYSLLVTGG